MVDVSCKPETEREALARGWVQMSPATLEALLGGALPKGDALPVARLAGIAAAKHTWEIVPLCHPLPLQAAEVEFWAERAVGRLHIQARVRAVARTGVEMEALVAVAAAALSVYDMCKAVEGGLVIGGIRLVEKSGGRTGEFRREEAWPPASAETVGRGRGGGET
ncbi:MAG: cyclic pyranopterin monophosphate synthase MoaC [Acetobacteraceae bacterium]|nr:cyclic pyranopterin monophosphate synthase MoaC [Acetobacteraceae bacterium]